MSEVATGVVVLQEVDLAVHARVRYWRAGVVKAILLATDMVP
jgi:hypothetical protein